MMKKYLLIPFLFFGLIVSGCTSPEETTPTSSIDGAPEKTPAVSDTIPSDGMQDYQGLSVTEAEDLADQNDVPFRVVMRDGEPLPATMDYRPGRINAMVEGDIVVSYDVEGQENTQKEPADRFDENSWKTMVVDDCQTFFDGCNTCRRIEGAEDVACTRKFCQHYEQPYCLDEMD